MNVLTAGLSVLAIGRLRLRWALLALSPVSVALTLAEAAHSVFTPATGRSAWQRWRLSAWRT
jgi:hypothetical protein